MFADSRTYPAMTVRGMYHQEQQLSKAEEAGLIITSADLRGDDCPCNSCPLNDGVPCLICIHE